MNTEAKSRTFKLLATLIELYIQSGKPVASKMLAEHSALNLSSASIRNIMAELEADGYLISPHTSAGRIPTVKGYRLFVDTLVQKTPDQDFDLPFDLNDTREPKFLVRRASSLLSEVTQLAGLISLPKTKTFILRQIDFLPLGNCRVLVVLVINDFEVQNRVIVTRENYSETQLKEAVGFLNAEYASKSLMYMREDLIQRMQQYKREMENMMQSVMQVVNDACNAVTEEYVVAGESHLISCAQETGLNRLQALLDAFNEKRIMLDLLDRCADANGVKIFIGKETGIDALDAYSMVAAPYQKNNELLGVIGVIGPTRMAYQEVIRAVDVTAKLLSQALSKS